MGDDDHPAAPRGPGEPPPEPPPTPDEVPASELPDSGGSAQAGARPPRKKTSSAAKTITASQSIVSGRIPQEPPKPGSTGFFKPLPVPEKAERVWAAIGLRIGRRLATVIRDDHVYLILMAAVVGIVSGGAAGLLIFWIEYAMGLFPSTGDADVALRWTAVIGIPVAGGFIAGGLRYAAKRFLSQPLPNGVPAVIESIARRGGQVHGPGAAVVGVGTGMTLGSGGSTGHEGPSVAIGAAVGSVLARFFGLRQRRHMALVGAGCAGGLAAAFNAPLAGVIFTVELVFGGSIGGVVGTMSVFIPLIVAAVAGTFTAHAIHGNYAAFDLAPHATPGFFDLLFYVALAVLAGLIGSAMLRLIVEVRKRFEAYGKIPDWVKPAIGALGVGLLAAVFSTELLGPGHATVERALDADLTWKLALMLLVLKMIATALSFGSGGFGGVFMPSLYVGACLGTLIGIVAHIVLGGDAQGISAYALVGMGAIFAATMHAPLTPIVLVFELTKDYGIILPLMLSCILSVVVARRVSPTPLYKALLQLRGVTLQHEAEGEVMKRGFVRDLMLEPQVVLQEDADLDEIRTRALENNMNSVFVVSQAGAVIGYLNGNQLAKRMLAGEISPDSTARDLMAKRKLVLLYPLDTLAGAIVAFARSGQELLPVVDGDRALLGLLRRGDIMAHYTEKVLGEQEDVVQIRADDAGVDQEVGLGKGLILDRIVVGRAWAGQSLAGLDLRGKTGVQVLEWTRDDKTLEIDPRAPLREGDTLAVAGRREQLLKTRALW